MKHLKTVLVFFILVSVNSISSQNLLSEFHRKYIVQEDWSLNKVHCKYNNDSNLEEILKKY